MVLVGVKIAVAVLTWNRRHALEAFLASLRHGHTTAIFEDGGYKDDTVPWLVGQAVEPLVPEPELDAYRGKLASGPEVFVGMSNLGVAGNTNRALWWFESTDCDYLMLCNDDITATGDFGQFYADGMQKLGTGLACFCGFENEHYAYELTECQGIKVKLLTRMTGSMMAISRQLFDAIGYFDTRFGKFGEEHCHYTNRASLAGFQCLGGVDRYCIDLAGAPLTQSMEIESTLNGGEKAAADRVATTAAAAVNFVADGLYCHFQLVKGAVVNGAGKAGTSLATARKFSS